MTDEPQVHNRDGMKSHDISVETERTYFFEDGFQYKVSFPKVLYIKRTARGDSHRVVDNHGTVHYVPAGWRVLKWKVFPGQPPVLF